MFHFQTHTNTRSRDEMGMCVWMSSDLNFRIIKKLVSVMFYARIHLIKPPHEEEKKPRSQFFSSSPCFFSFLSFSFSLFYFFKCWSSWWEGSFDIICCGAKFSNGKCNAIQQQAFSNIWDNENFIMCPVKQCSQ